MGYLDIDWNPKILILVCKITKDEANLIGRFIDNDIVFTAFSEETEDGYYLVTKNDYERVKERPEILRVDFTNKEWVDIETIELKIIE